MSLASSVPLSEPSSSWGASASPPDYSPDTHRDHVNVGLYVCHMCNKHYSRHCDLNKHLKTHNRSFKCPVEGCRYNSFGWPTEKELERHHNDKHSTAPKVYSCWYQPCNYTSKRESNCKQHMEKTHGWQYIRSRAVNRDDGSTSNPAELTPHGDTVFVSDSDAIDLNLHNVPDLMLTPSPLEQHLPTPHDGTLSMAFGSTMQYAPGVYGAWTSPVTPLGNNGPFVGATGQAHTLESPRPTPDDEMLMVPVDPRLCRNAQDASPTTADLRDLPVAAGRQAMLKTLPTIVTAKSSPVVKSQVLTPTSDLSPAFFSTAVSYRRVVRPDDADFGPRPSSSATQSLSIRSTSLRKTDGKRQERPSSDPDDDDYDDDDDEPPTKRNKGGQDGKQGDPKLICPFRAEHPDVYNRDLDPRYASCHTEHANISTVIRHLGRPAHKLQVDNSKPSTVASFNIADPAYDHPAAGLCRKCWTNFDDRQAFDDHIKGNCVSRSRGKLEKFDLIRNTFCQLRSDVAASKRSSDKGKAIEGETADAADAAPVAAQAHRLDTISRHEFDSLVQRVTELEQRLALNRTGSTPRVVPQQARAVVRAFSSSPALPSSQASHPFGLYVYDDGAGPSRAVSGNNLAQQSLGSLGRKAMERGSSAGQYNNNQSNMSSFRMNATSRSGSASTLRRENATSTTARGLATQQLRPFGEHNSNNSDNSNSNPFRQVETPAYGSTATANPTAVVAAGDLGARAGASVVDNPLRLAGIQTGDGETSQQSTNTTMRNQWDQAVQMNNDILGRGGGMDFCYNPGDDFSKYLNMGSQ